MKSMTGYGKAEYIDEKCRVKVELKSTNSRYLDLQFNINGGLRALEIGLRQKIANVIKRGRIDCYIYLEKYYTGEKKIKVNTDLLEQLLGQLKNIKDDSVINREMRLDMLLALPGIVESGNEIEDLPEWLIEAIHKTVLKAISEIEKMRISEGARLKETIAKNISFIERNIELIKNELHVVNEELFEKYRVRLKRYAAEAEMDESRLSTEAAIAAERADVSEEIARLESHIREIKSALNAENEPNGKRLDFLSQEMSREINTLNAKTAGMKVNLLGVETKLEIEKLREQAQNIE